MASESKYLQLTSFDRHIENPFLEEAIEDIERHRVKKLRRIGPKGNVKEAGQVIVQQTTGEVVGYGAFMQYIEVDEKQFAKIYVGELERFFDLNKTSRAVLNYVLSLLKPNQDIVTIRLQECMQECGYKTKKSVIEGIAHLINAGLLARARYENEYFINPLAMFNGDRVTYAKTYVKRRKEAEKNTNQLDLFGDDLRQITLNSMKNSTDGNRSSTQEPAAGAV